MVRVCAQLDLAAMQAELDEVRRLCEAVQSPVVFAHNDLLSGNILVLQARAELRGRASYAPRRRVTSAATLAWQAVCHGLAQAPQVDVADASQCDLSGPLQFIDFEYSVAGYRGFDWGNHFNEYAGARRGWGGVVHCAVHSAEARPSAMGKHNPGREARGVLQMGYTARAHGIPEVCVRWSVRQVTHRGCCRSAPWQGARPRLDNHTGA